MTSPKVTVRERNLANRVASTPGVYGAIVVGAHKGPVNTPVLTTSDSQYLNVFTPDGTIGVNDDPAHHSALKFLESSDKLWVIRAAASDAAYGGLVFSTDAAESKSGDSALESSRVFSPDMGADDSSVTNEALAVIGESQGAWNDEVKVDIRPDDTGLPASADAFKLVVSYKQETPEEFVVSRKEGEKDGFGNSLFVSDVVNGNSKYIRVVNLPGTGVPKVQRNSGFTVTVTGSTGAAPTSGSNDVIAVNGYVTNVNFATAGGSADDDIITVTVNNASGTEVLKFSVKLGAALPTNDSGFAIASDGSITSATASLVDGTDSANPPTLLTRVFTDTSLTLGGGKDGADLSTERGAAIETVSNPDIYDVKLFMDGGVSNVSYQKALIELAEDRGDAHAILGGGGAYVSNDISATVENAVAYRNDLGDSSYGVFYFPEMRHEDRFNGRLIWQSPDGFVAGKISEAAANGNIWDPVAGFDRGVINSALDVRANLTVGHMDRLYSAGVNPIRRRANGGIYIWGQKTLLKQAKPDDRLNVRAMLNEIKPDIRRFLEERTFNLNTPTERNTIASRIGSYMSVVRSRNGVSRFQVQSDEDNNPPEVVDNLELVVWLFVWPTRAAEYITFEVIVAPSGVTINEI